MLPGMFGLARVILAFDGAVPAEAIQTSLARFQRGGSGDVPDAWLAFVDEAEYLRAVREAQPRRAGRCEVHVPAWPLVQPRFHHGGLVRGVVVHGEMDVHVPGHICFYLVEEAPELGCPVAGEAFADEPTSLFQP